MNLKLFFVAFFLIAIVSVPMAQQQDYLELNLSGISLINFAESQGISRKVSASGGYGDYSFFGKLGIGLLNMPFGLGSYIAGEWKDGLTITFTQVGGVGLSILGSSMLNSMKETNHGTIDGEAAGRMTMTTIGGVVLLGAGIGTVASILLDGIFWPFGQYLFIRPPSIPSKKEKARQAQNNNLSMVFIPMADGNIVGQINYTTQF